MRAVVHGGFLFVQVSNSSGDKRRASEIFKYYQEKMAEYSQVCSDVLDIHKTKYASNMVEEIGIDDAKLVIDFAVRHWNVLKNINDSKNKLLDKPNFYQIIAVWNYTKWLHMLQNNEISLIEQYEKRFAVEQYERELKKEYLKKWKKIG